MFFRRLKNLWKLSAYTPQDIITQQKDSIKKDPVIGKHKKQRLATIVQDEPLEIFPSENDKTN